jgi:hypothetical protein
MSTNQAAISQIQAEQIELARAKELVSEAYDGGMAYEALWNILWTLVHHVEALEALSVEASKGKRFKPDVPEKDVVDYDFVGFEVKQ